eukprot:scaffold97762_cov28-Tisochrysis_lutea.AAC.1
MSERRGTQPIARSAPSPRASSSIAAVPEFGSTAPKTQASRWLPSSTDGGSTSFLVADYQPRRMFRRAEAVAGGQRQPAGEIGGRRCGVAHVVEERVGICVGER